MNLIVPSEKHLENWIVNNIPAFQRDFGQSLHRLIGQQVRFPSGIADLVFAGTCCMWIVELKKGRVGGAAFAQLSHYLNDANNEYAYIQQGYTDENDPHFHTDNFQKQHATNMPVKGVLVGSSFDLLAYKAAWGSDQIWLLEYSYDLGTDSYNFSSNIGYHDAIVNDEENFDPLILGGLREVMRHTHLLEYDVKSLKELYTQEGWIK